VGSRTPAAKQTFSPEKPSRDWSILFWLLVTAALAQCWFVGRILDLDGNGAPGESTFSDGLFRLLSVMFSAYPKKPARAEKPFLLAINLAAFCAMWMMTTSVACFFYTGPFLPNGDTQPTWNECLRLLLQHGWTWADTFAGSLACLCLLRCAVQLTSWKTLRQFRGYNRVRIPAWLLAGGITVVWSLFVFERRYRAGYFAAYRALHVTSGVTPLIPFIFGALGLCCWAWAQLKRENMVAVRKTILRNRTPEINSKTRDFYKDIHRIDDALRDPFSGRIWLPAAICFFLLVLIRGLYPTLDPLKRGTTTMRFLLSC
jgi:hypothetical protein